MYEEIYIDFDGVIADTQSKIDYYFSLFDNNITPEWNKFLANIDWKNDVLCEAKEINNSFEILKELYKMKRDVCILSRVFSLNEYKDKLEYLRDNGVYTKVIPTPGRKEKAEVIIPSKEKLLIDDSKSNIKNWIDNNGYGIFFTNNPVELSKEISFDNGFYYKDEDDIFFRENVNNLKFLLKKKS